ncbi:MAG: 4,5-DOPA dioxygenase extradiol [Quisquiliibacterium sp.]
MTAMPLVFFGHGSPTNTLETNRHTQAWRLFGASRPVPRAILMISAHWYLPHTAVTAMPQPRTIHDFYGFPKALAEFQYPARGDPELAQQVSRMLKPTPVSLDHEWGLDHGAWSVLAHAYPNADVPVVQLSIDSSLPAASHFDLGRRIGALRDEGVLIAGSGNVVHNLGLLRRNESVEPYDWADQFDNRVRAAIEQSDHASLVRYDWLGEDYPLSIPTPEHYLPLIYVLGARRPQDRLSVLTDGIELGSISMSSYAFDAP